MELNLPVAVDTYLTAVRTKNSDLFTTCLADGAIVRDEEKEYRGIEEIQAWRREADAKYQYATEALDVLILENTVTLRARLTGNFPGSPVEVDYLFTLADGKIAALEIR